MPKRAWNNWFHCNGNTHGTWTRGDKRGWRSRHHREHVEGDYKNPPPPERDAWLRKNSLKLLKKPPTLLTLDRAILAGNAMVRRLLDADIQLLSFALDDHHFHLVAQFPDHRPRYYIGLAKQRAAFLLVRQMKMVSPIWAKRCLCKPIEDRAHQIRAVNYDLEHVDEGALFVWSFKDPIPPYIEVPPKKNIVVP